MREYFLEDGLHPKGGITIKCKDDHDCVFCKHCTDVFWDYTSLIYMIICDLDRDPWERPCACFTEAEEDDYCSYAEPKDTTEEVRKQLKDMEQRREMDRKK